MSERYSRLFSLPENLYAVGSPVIIAAGTLLKDNQTGKIVAQLKLRSLSNRIIKAVTVSLNLFDTAGNPISETVEYQYLDLSSSRDDEFGQKNPVPVPSKGRSYTASVTEVVFEDRSVWTSGGEPWEPLSRPILLQINDPELLEQYKIRFGYRSTYEPKEEKDLWYCTCGELNRAGEGCHCGNSLFELQTVDMDALAAEKDARLAKEARQAAEEKAAAEAVKKKIAKTLKIVIPAVCAVIAIALLVTKVIIPNSKYNNAVALMEAGAYEEAIAAFEAMDGYKDSTAQIVNCENAIEAAEQSRIEAEMAAEFARAEELLAAGDYDGAIAIFESLADYEGSAEGIAAAEEGKVEAAYRAAEALAESGETAKAAIAFGKLGDYEDARERSLELWETLPYPYETIGAGRYHTVALLNNGTVKATGHTEYGQCDTESWKNVIAISVGNTHTVGLKPDGTVIGVGSDYKGCLQISNWTDIVFVSAGGGHTVGIKADGSVIATGANDDGQCNVSGWKDIVAISAGNSHTVGLKADGTVVAVGRNDSGQCDVSGWTDIIAISAGNKQTVALKADGTVVTVGAKMYMYNSKNKIAISDWRDVVAVSAGWDYAVGLKSDGTVITTGYGVWSNADVSDWTDIVAISAKEHHTVGLKSDGTMIVEGYNKDNRCNVSSWKNIKLPN